jgi:hypothetical protein
MQRHLQTRRRPVHSSLQHPPAVCLLLLPLLLLPLLLLRLLLLLLLLLWVWLRHGGCWRCSELHSDCLQCLDAIYSVNR